MNGGLDIVRRRGASDKSRPIRSPIVVAAVCVLSAALFTALIGRVRLSSQQEVPQRKIGGVKYELPKNQAPKPPLLQQKPKLEKNKESLIEPNNDEDKNLGEVMRGELHLVELQIRNGLLSNNDKDATKNDSAGYNGVTAFFCKVNWDLYKADPPSLPMYHSLLTASGCNQNRVGLDMATVVDRAREYDKLMEQKIQNGNVSEINGYVHSMQTSGFVFHESRVGSTLVANSLVAMDPTLHRVYSESSPITDALLACGRMGSQCDMNANVELFRDVVYLMGRTNDPMEQRQFFKVSSVGTKSIDIFRKAFPDVPWIFVYRNPVQTMMSHMDPAKGKRGIQRAVCLRSITSPPADLRKIVSKAGRDVKSLSNEEFCAAHLASLCESALREMKASSMGKSIEYDGLVENLIAHVIPNHFGIKVGNEERQRILDVSTVYSKSKSKSIEWVEDSNTKEESATVMIRDASKQFLENSYNELQKYNAA